MPPALTDDEASASGEEDIPFRKKPDDKMSDIQNGEENGSEEGDEDEREEYIVEAILSHAFDDEEVLKYEVKWLGYEKKSDRTWEPEDNLSGAKDLLMAYHKKIGGRPKLGDPAPASGRKRKQSGTPTARANQKQRRRKSKAGKNVDDDETPTAKSKIKSEPTWEPPAGLWEQDVISVESVEQTVDSETGGPKLMGYIVWKDEKKTQHTLQTLYRKCPQKMLQYYERHLTWNP